MHYIFWTTALFSIVAACIAAPLSPLPPTNTAADHQTNVGGSDYEYEYNYTFHNEELEEEPDLSQRLTGPEIPVPLQYILSMSTGQFVAITKSGRVQANTQIGRIVAHFLVQYRRINGKEHASIQSVKYADRGWYLTVQANRKIRGSVPSNGNEIFQVVSLAGPVVAFKLRQEREEAVGSGEHDILRSDEEPVCFLGFSASDGRPSCYDSTNHVETHLLFLDIGA